jgi:hypothetical protein
MIFGCRAVLANTNCCTLDVCGNRELKIRTPDFKRDPGVDVTDFFL